MLSIIALFTIIIIVALLISNKITPIVALVLVPIVAAFVAGFSFAEIGDFFNSGVESVISVVIMFIFAILFFGIMQDVGLFDPLINKMIAVSKGNVIAVAVGTVVIAAVAQLDGSGASTFLITIPALLPLYKRLKMNPYLLLLLVGTSASIMNMLPWAGPLGRTAAVLGMDVTELWRPLIKVQVIGLILLIALAVLLAMREKRLIARRGDFNKEIFEEADPLDVTAQDEKSQKAAALRRPKLLWANTILALAVIGVLVWGVIPAGLAFMIGVSIALPLNYPDMKDQMDRIKDHAPNALLMAAIILAAGSFLGILEGTLMLDSIASDLVTILPAFVIPYLHLIIGFFGVPFDLLLSTDAYYFALFPIVEQVVTGAGVSSLTAAYAMIIGNIIGTFVSPFSPALWLALGLAGLEMGRHIRYSLPIMWGFSIVLLAVSVLVGVV
ncbi:MULTISPECIES: CitMHS family transporter [Planococcus]|uniref:Citrate transporter n=1 Tax=Planococcus maitriensis TaxID=221799 RepID=A0A365K3G0_9BACL|nr:MULTISPECIES: citrate:proton symporter [Planococcus]AUD13196.1 citrate transporter [Planococcus sp. MB-3u-03]PKG45316.1 citrate transporter [Planococcus sp. Urea-trap-24]PKG89088.1 citrate transporter [Planococcus sp. Urea-3u-39]PKH39303.1 citrate transporter [Planococcus sp. MB-3u-09]RAZ67177.1 citrate transporter [Planococcus maitriensis]